MNEKPEDAERWMTSAEAARYAQMSPEVLTRLARAKKIHHGFTGREYRFLRRHIDAFLAARGWAPEIARTARTGSGE